MGSLAKACSLTLQHRETVELDAVHKDAELERWNVAIDKGLNLGDKMLASVQHNLEQTLIDIMAEQPVLRAFHALVQANGSVKATATELLDEIEPFLYGPKDARYPTSGKQLAKLLRDHKRFMIGIEIEFDVLTGKNRDRKIVATWQALKSCDGGAPISPSPVNKPAKTRKRIRRCRVSPRLSSAADGADDADGDFGRKIPAPIPSFRILLGEQRFFGVA